MIVKPFIDSELRNDSVCNHSSESINSFAAVQSLFDRFSYKKEGANSGKIISAALFSHNTESKLFFIIFKMKFVSYNCFFFY